MKVELDLEHVGSAVRASVCPACGGNIAEGNSVTAHAFYRQPVHIDCETLLTPEQSRQLRNEQKKWNPTEEEA